MPVRYYLPLCHCEVGKIWYNFHLRKHFFKSKVEQFPEPEYIRKDKHMEYWWNILIITATKLPHNKTGLIIWNHGNFVCTSINFSFPLEQSIAKKVVEKKKVYRPLLCNIQIIYTNHKLEMILIIVGCLGYLQNALKMYMKW